MKLIVLVLCLSLLSVTLFARDLSSAARRERDRRAALAQKGQRARGRTFTDEDLNVYARFRVSAPRPRPATPIAARAASSEMAKRRAYWRAQKEKLTRELARLDAQIKRLEWRLAETRARNRQRPRGRIDAQDTTARLMEDSLEGLRADRRRMEQAFHERARKAGALPGWLR